ncbi:DEAD/DEAH box helicase [Massilia antarctica]|uniref:DEAD/DEAH box helicase n=1 Tax=Massilia antarctica TaxID=2765360 RepID=UPI0022722780|nr:DEAD/DEAH box helicase [Massilia sp. H27-R4]MCY0911022.1 DEAD/DEAH box helicase [Massilia sp. H27-R4]
MKPEFESRRLFGITRSKGKMLEFGLPENSHIKLPPGVEPESLLLLTVGTLGDFVVELHKHLELSGTLGNPELENISFSASYFDALLSAGYVKQISNDLMLLAAAAYYLARRPGSSFVIAKRLTLPPDESPADALLRWILQAKWANYLGNTDPSFGEAISDYTKLLAFHFHDGSNSAEVLRATVELRKIAYRVGSPREVLFVDIGTAIAILRLTSSSWNLLPKFSNLNIIEWAPVIRKFGFPKEFWPSQVLLGETGFFRGNSGVIQMPTSAGKTRSVEIIIRSAFMSGRAKLAVVIAPFRALCHEIGDTLAAAFKGEDVKVNELTDALQLDFLAEIAELFGKIKPETKYILVVTPEKLLYILRQQPLLTADIGLVIYDEGHQFDSGNRGVTYELLLTEIKSLLLPGAQTVLVSAVMQNSHAVGNWLIGENSVVANGKNLLPTSRSVAFTTWLESAGQLLFYESTSYKESDSFVPRVINKYRLLRLKGEKKDRFFPDNTSTDAAKDVALQLGISLIPSGTVAIFCGKKDTVTSLAERVADIYMREYPIPSPATSADQLELSKLKTLISRHFGPNSVLYKCAASGVFCHHGNTPHGLRLSIEFALQSAKIKFVICTSTLAQGVNLPIRYLILTGVHQAGVRLKTRDFQNLIGRAGRAGIHTEGLIIFSDPKIIDLKADEPWHFDTSVNLLNLENSEDTTSSLLAILDPFNSPNKKINLPMKAEEIVDLIFGDIGFWSQWAQDQVNRFGRFGYTVKGLLDELHGRVKLLTAVESYLMSQRGNIPFEEFKIKVTALVETTLAFSLASESMKEPLRSLFTRTADYINDRAPLVTKQLSYAKTLLGVRSAIQIEAWVEENKDLLNLIEDSGEWLAASWPILSDQINNKFFHSITPPDIGLEIAHMWIKGTSYMDIISYAQSRKAKKPWGENAYHAVTEMDILTFIENTLGFEAPLVLAAIAQFLYNSPSINAAENTPLSLFHKRLKYGLPGWLAISCFEYGFADRMLALDITRELSLDGYEQEFFTNAMAENRATVQRIVDIYPSYFEGAMRTP